MAEFEFGGMTFRGGKMAVVLTALSTAGGALWGGFEFYKDYVDMKEVVQNIDIDKIKAGLTIGYNTFFTFYWMLTLFHVIHILVGLIILGSVFIGIRKRNGTITINDFEASAAFWHMCDLIWLLLFPIIYLIF